jgi:hypothetical protein
MKYYSDDKIWKNEMGMARRRMGERGGVYRVLVGQPEGNWPHVRHRCRWEDNIKMDIQEMGWGTWTGSIWLRKGTGGGHL